MPQQKTHLRFVVLATDVVLFTYREGQLYVRLIPVHLPPHYVHLQGLPGGLVWPEETAEQAADRLLRQKALIQSKDIYREQLYTFSDVNRDPRGRVVSVAYLALLPWKGSWSLGGEHARWHPVNKLPTLAYDHQEIVRVALERLRSKLFYSTLVSKLMPKEFTLTELEKVYEHLLRSKMDKRNFRKKVLRLGLLKNVGKKRRGLRQRPADLFTFVTKKVEIIEML